MWVNSIRSREGRSLCFQTSDSQDPGPNPRVGQVWPWLSGADLSPLLPSVSGPCDHEDLRDGVIFGAKYLGSTQLVSERNPPPSTRMAQAQEAVDRIKVKPGAGGGLVGKKATDWAL